MSDLKRTCIHDSEEELTHFVNCDHADIVGYDPDDRSIEKFGQNVPKLIEQKEKLLTRYEIGSRRENPAELSCFEGLFQDDSEKTNNCFENYINFDMPDIYSLELRIKNILGEKQYNEYKGILKSWFSFEINQEKFEKSLHACFSKDDLKVHNEYMQALFKEADSDNNIIEDYSYFIDDLVNEKNVDKKALEELSFSGLFFNDENVFDSTEFEKTCDELDEDDEDLMIVKKRKGKRSNRFLDDDDDDDDELSGEATSGSRDVVEILSDDDLNSVPKKKRKRKAMLILSDDEDGNDENVYYETESSNSNAFNADSDGSKVIDAKSSVPLKTTVANLPVRSEHNFSLLSKILNSDKPISLLDVCNSENEIEIKEENSNSEQIVMQNFETNIAVSEPVTQSSQTETLMNSKIAELLNRETSDLMEILPSSPLANSPATLNFLSNSDDLSNNSENMMSAESSVKIEPTETSEIVEDNIKIPICKTIQNFEIFDPIMDSSLNSMDSRNKVQVAEDIKTRIISVEENDETSVKSMSSEEKVTKLQTCYQEVSLPDNIRLGLRISQLATVQGFLSVDKRVTHICNVALKNFIRNILTQLIVSRNSFTVKNNRILFNIGGQPINPYLRNSYKHVQRELSPDMSPFSNFKPETLNDRLDRQSEQNEQCWRMASLFDSKLKLGKFGLRRNELCFNEEDQVKIDRGCNEPKRKLRPLSGMLYFPDYRKNCESSCTLYHLYDLLNSHRSLIPVAPVWSRTLYRTVAAFNNLADSEK